MDQEEEHSPFMSHYQNDLDKTPKNKEFHDDGGYDSLKRRQTLSPSDLPFLKNRLVGMT